MIWLTIALYVLSLVVSYRLRPKPEEPRAATLTGIQVPTADETRPIPKLYGTKWIPGPNVLWYGHLKTTKITEKGGRKYGIAGPREKITVGYKYYLGMHLGLCLGPVRTILGIDADEREAWRGYAGQGDTIEIDAEDLFGGDKAEGGIRGLVDVAMGDADQEVNSYLAARLPAPLPAFRGTACLIARQVYIGTSAYIKNWRVLASSVIDKPAVGGADWAPWDTTGLVIANSPIRSFATNGEGVWMALQTRVSQPTQAAAALYVYRSTDNAQSWELIRTWTDGEVSNSSGAVARIAYGDGTWVLVHTAGNAGDPNGSFVRYSQDNGATWDTPVTPIPVGMSTGDVIFTGSHFVAARGRIPLAPWTGNTIYRAGNPPNVWLPVYSTDTNAGNDVRLGANGFGTVIMLGSVNSGTLIISRDHGINWERFDDLLSGTTILQENEFALDAGEFKGGSTRWILVRKDRDAYVSDDDGATWEIFPLPSDDIRVVKSDRRGNWLFGAGPQGATPGNRIYRSIDDGETIELQTGPAAETTAITPYIFETDRAGLWVVGALSSQGWSYTLDGPVPDLLQGDMNPADIIAEALTDPVSGLGYADSDLTSGTAFGSFDYARELFQLEGFGLSFLQNYQDSIESFIRTVQEHCDAALQVDPVTGKWILVPIRDDWEFDDLPVADESVVVELIEYFRPGYGDLINQVSVVYDDRLAAKERTITVQNYAVLAVQGAVSAQSTNYPGIARADLANAVAARDLRAMSTPLARVQLRLRPEFGFDLRAGSVFRFDWPPLGITGMVLRVVTINYGDLINGAVTVTCTEDVFATAAPLYETPPASGWVDPSSDPVPVDVRNVQEAPYRLLLSDVIGDTAELDEVVDALQGVALVHAVPPSGDSDSFEIQSRIDPDEFARENDGDFSPSLPIPEALPQEIQSVISFPAGSDLDGVAAGQLALLGLEWVRIAEVDGLDVTIDRGILDTPPVPAAVGSRLWFTDLAFGVAESVRDSGDVVIYRLLTRTGLGLLPLEALDADEDLGTDANEDTLLFDARGIRPLPPGDFTIGGERYPTQLDLVAPLTVSWAHRDRLLQGTDLVLQDAADIGPEAGTTYHLRVTGLSGTVLFDQTGITDTTWDLTEPDIAEVAITIELWAVRDYFESWEPQRCLVFSAYGLGFGLGNNLGGRGPVYQLAYSDTQMNFGAGQPDLRYLAPVLLGGKAYVGRKVFDSATLAELHEWEILRDPEPYVNVAGAYTETFTAQAYVSSQDLLIGLRWRETVLAVVGGISYYGTTKALCAIDPDTYEVSADLVDVGQTRNVEYVEALDRVLAVFTGSPNIRKFNPATWAIAGNIAAAPDGPVTGREITGLYFHEPTGTLYFSIVLASRLYYADGTSAGDVQTSDYQSINSAMGIAYVPPLDRIVVCGHGTNPNEGKLFFIDPSDSSIDTGLEVVVDGYDSFRDAFYNAVTNRIYISTLRGHIIVFDVTNEAVEFVTAVSAPDFSAGGFPRWLTQEMETGRVFYHNGKFLHILT